MADDGRPLEEENAKVLAEIVSDPLTSEHIRIQVINKLLESNKDKNFFDTMFEELMSVGECPNCQHVNHWLIPEDTLNQLGVVTSEIDSRVKPHTTIADCPELQEACLKKKVSS